jgi:excisionase family DNA binding protein
MGSAERSLAQETTPSFPHTLGRSVAIDQAAQLLGVSRRTIYNRIRDGQLQTIRTLGGSQRVTVESLHHLGFKRQPPAPQAPPAMAAVERLERGSA